MNEDIEDSDFLREVSDAFSTLIARGLLTVVSSSFDSMAFGNAIVVLAGRNVQVRLVRDRGDAFAEAAPASGTADWVPLEWMIAAVGVRNAPQMALRGPAEVAGLLEEHLDELNSGLSTDNLLESIAKLRELEAEAGKQAMERWGRKGSD